VQIEKLIKDADIKPTSARKEILRLLTGASKAFELSGYRSPNINGESDVLSQYSYFWVETIIVKGLCPVCQKEIGHGCL